MKYSFDKKVAIITGSSKGIGKALTLALAQQGAKVVLNGRNKAQLQQVYDEFKNKGFSCLAIAGDISDYAFCQKMIDQVIGEFGKIDILINNAGLSAEGKIEDTSAEVFKKTFDVNVLGVLYPTKAAIPYLKKVKGHIIITGSIAGFMGLPEFSTYSGAKMALTAISQSLRIELAGSGVHVGLNYVGFVENENKTYLDKDGKVVPMPERASFQRMPREKVAAIFLEGIKKRHKYQVLSPLGKVTSLFSRLFPRLFEQLMTYRYQKKQQG